jgi:hypothetical protein
MKKLISIIIYILPVLVITILTKRTTYFLLSAGIMTIILGLSLRFIPNVIGYKHKNQSNYLMFIVAGLCLVIASSQI